MPQEPRKNLKIGYIVRRYIIFHAVVCALILGVDIYLYTFSLRAGFFVSLLLITHVIASAVFLSLNTKNLFDSLIKFAKRYETLEGDMLSEFPVPYAVSDSDGFVLTYNFSFEKICDNAADITNIRDVFKELKPEDTSFQGNDNNVAIVYNGRNYRIQIKKLRVDGSILSERGIILPKSQRPGSYMLAYFLFDETEIVNMTRRGIEEQLVVCSLYIDNYTEAMDKIDEYDQSLYAAMVERVISRYFLAVDGVVRKLDRDRFMILLKRKYLSVLQRKKFDVLDSVKEINPGVKVPMTISIGVGVGGSYGENCAYADSALDLALSRGGAQAVVKEGGRIYFYGGKTKQVEKNTRVMARVKALSIREILMNKDHVVVMGHKTGDMDSFGASVGIYRAARALGKRAYIVLNELNNSVRPILESFMDDPEYKKDVFISNDEADEYVDRNTALVVVDVNRPGYFECPNLVRLTDTVIMVDHHIQSGERIDSLVLSYVSPTASSACEMVSEILQYIADQVNLKQNEAEALYAGILLDTNYFSKNTGVRTFEAAAFLRKCGVDVARVKSLFSDSLDDFKAKAEAVKTAEILDEGFIFAESPSEGLENPTVVAAQVANELLDINGIRGSFVVTKVGSKLYISARSRGDVNVQLAMERIGGGGHMNMAGAQLDNTTAEEAFRLLGSTVRKLKEEGILK